jgi:hypothetical protein
MGRTAMRGTPCNAVRRARAAIRRCAVPTQGQSGRMVQLLCKLKQCHSSCLSKLTSPSLSGENPAAHVLQLPLIPHCAQFGAVHC